MTSAGAGSVSGRARPRPTAGTHRTQVQLVAAAMGAVFLLVGVLGFVPGITTHYGDMKFAGPNSDAMLIGLFCVSVLHNIVHLLFGVVGLAMARTTQGARSFLLGGGLVYLVLFIYGIFVDKQSNANFVPLNGADNVLHALLAVVMIGAGPVLSRRDLGVRA